MSTKSVVKTFLQELRYIIELLPDPIFFVDRPKNSVQYLADLGITARMREEIIAQLQIEDYSQGPEVETQFGGTELWIFGKNIKDQEVYIKLTIARETGKAICISFHKAEYPMDYPLKK